MHIHRFNSCWPVLGLCCACGAAPAPPVSRQVSLTGGRPGERAGPVRAHGPLAIIRRVVRPPPRRRYPCPCDCRSLSFLEMRRRGGGRNSARPAGKNTRAAGSACLPACVPRAVRTCVPSHRWCGAVWVWVGVARGRGRPGEARRALVTTATAPPVALRCLALRCAGRGRHSAFT